MWKFRKSEEGKQPPKHQRMLLWVERFLLIVGIALLVGYGAVRLESFLASRAALRRFEAIEAAPRRQSLPDENETAATAENESIPTLDLPEADFKLWDKGRVKAYRQAVGKRSGVPLAVLRISKIHLEVPVFDGTDDLTLNHAVGRIAGTAWLGEDGNIGIAGHRDSFFRGLKDVAIGDAIELQTLQGALTYVVDDIQIVIPEDTSVLRQRPMPTLTLVTCYPFYFFGSAPERYIVTASLSNGEIKSGLENPPSAIQPSVIQQGGRKMRNTHVARLLGKGAASVFVVALVAIGSWAQDTTITTTQHGVPSYSTEAKNAEIVYVEGNDLVLKLENGRVEHLVVPDSDKFTIDGKEVTVHELVPGTKLTQTITTTTTPRYVNTVRTIEGKVWHVNAPNSVILTLPDNKNQRFEVPDHAKFSIDGQNKTVWDLRKGMKIKATVVTDDEHTVVERNKLAFGQAPPPATPREVGVLLFRLPQPEPVTLASAEPAADTLPKTGTLFPLMGLLGLSGIGASLALGAVRRAVSR